MKRLMRLSPVMRVFVMAILAGAPVYAQTLSFVTCPIVRDTKTVPCWLAEYNGELYYLGNQGGVAQDFYPPQLNHEVLVEGTIAEGSRVCGGVPLRPVKTSVFLEINRACNTILPVEDGIEAPARAPGREPVSWVRSDGPSDTTLYFDFDNDFLSLHTATAVQRIAEQFQQTKASAIEVQAFRGSSRLSNGTELLEQAGIAERRAAKIREILEGLGVPKASVRAVAVPDVRRPNGVDDPWSRRVTLSVKK
jgi:outer membrane protein OmpA-like peptidoglycan-associated protein